ncbi:hypothetical protein [Natrinema salaciae]|uniref:Uncharacterized protein n=1 Tax=Natrinema salaciae TaxID=1186196 RepID=A0A1H9LVD4_9EURY|nr:hypothetical protein SAMN04489841_3102 [Natrinema salaciae]
MAIEDQLKAANWVPGSVTLREFMTQPGTADEESIVAEMEGTRPLQLRDDPDSELRLVLTAYEHHTTDDTADNTETFELESPTTQDLLLWEDGAVVDSDFKGLMKVENGTFWRVVAE